MRSRYCTAGSRDDVGSRLASSAASHVVERLGQLVEGRVAVDLVFHRIEVHLLVGRVAGDDLVGAHHPHAGAFLAPGVDVARHLDRHLRVGGVQAAAVLVVEARPCCARTLPRAAIRLLERRLHQRRPACQRRALARHAASAASRTQAPSSQALTRAPQALAVARAVAADDAPELVPVDRAEVVVLALLVPLQLRVGQVTPSILACSTVGVDELLRAGRRC